MDSKGLHTGSWAAFIFCPEHLVTRKTPVWFQHGSWLFTFVCGAAMPIKVGRAEISAVNAALSFVTEMGLMKDLFRVEIVTDSQYVEHCMTGTKERVKNQDLWAQFDFLARQLDVGVRHTDRNSEKEQAMADALCHHLHKTISAKLEETICDPNFTNLTYSR